MSGQSRNSTATVSVVTLGGDSRGRLTLVSGSLKLDDSLLVLSLRKGVIVRVSVINEEGHKVGAATLEIGSDNSYYFHPGDRLRVTSIT